MCYTHTRLVIPSQVGDHYGQNVAHAVEMAKLCADAGEPACQGLLGFMYGTGTGVKLDTAKVCVWACVCMCVWSCFGACRGDSLACGVS